MVKKHRAILYFQDESNVSLTAFLGKTWAPCGQTPRSRVTGKRAGVAALSALSRRGHLLFRLLEKRIASREVIDFLQQMLRHHPRRHLVVVMDQAPPHTSKKTRAFIDQHTRLHVFYLPKYSPDWNPDEKVWNHLKHQELKSHQAKTKDELKHLTRRKLRSMAKRPHLMRGLFFRCCVADVNRRIKTRIESALQNQPGLWVHFHPNGYDWQASPALGVAVLRFRRDRSPFRSVGCDSFGSDPVGAIAGFEPFGLSFGGVDWCRSR
jgi:transposase